MRNPLIFVLAALLLGVWSTPALALIYGNPVPKDREGVASVGIGIIAPVRELEYTTEGISEDENTEFSRQTFLVGYGLANGGLIRAYFGPVSVEVDDLEGDGNEFGLGYRHPFQTGGDLELGFIGNYLTGAGSEEGVDVTYTLLDLGVGGSAVLQDNLSAYFAGLYSSLTGVVEYDDFDYTTDVEGTTSIGGFAGIEFRAGDQFLLGGEVHLIHENGFGFFAELLF